MIIDRIALILAVIGGLNWGLVGLFRFDLVAYLFGGQTATVSRIVYTLVGIAAVWCISLLFRRAAAAEVRWARRSHRSTKRATFGPTVRDAMKRSSTSSTNPMRMNSFPLLCQILGVAFIIVV